MKYYTKIFFGLLMLIFSQNSFAATQRPFGLGVLIGSPSAITGKFWLDTHQAIDMGFGYSNNDYFLFYADYLVHFTEMIPKKNKFLAELVPYIGVGAIIVSNNQDRYDNDRYYGKKSGAIGSGLRVPVGVEWTPVEIPIGVFLEVVPGISLTPATSGFINSGVGIRYYF